MKLEFGYGQGMQAVELPEANLIGVLTPNEVELGLTGEDAVRDALAHPIGSARLGELVRPGQTVVIITSDITRPMPTAAVMPALLDELYAAGIRREDITLVFGLGSHRPQTEAEMRRLAGERAYHEVRCMDSTPDDCVSFGHTGRGTPVDICRAVAESDVRVCLGNIEYHYFAGYSGGAKALMPGASTREAIQKNHSLMADPNAFAGKLDGNPIREDIEEAGRIVGIHFILNVVLDEHKRIVHAVAGDPVAAHRAGCAFLDRFYLKHIPARADIVLVSQGGAPKDLNLYQVQKALDNAKHAVKPGGVVILIGSCAEGLGEEVFEQWMTGSPSPAAMVERIRRDFQLGGHKAAAIAMVLQDAEIYLVSDMPDELVRRMFLRPFPTAQAALDDALAKLGGGASILAMPYGGSTLPRVSA